MKPINPLCVQTPDKRIGVLVARHELHACVEFGPQRILETFPITVLLFHETPKPREFRKMRMPSQKRV